MQSLKYLKIVEMLKGQLGINNKIDISISKYEKKVDKFPKLSSLKNKSSLKKVADDYGYKIEIIRPKVYLVKNNESMNEK